jgi:hypothetical protein
VWSASGEDTVRHIGRFNRNELIAVKNIFLIGASLMAATLSLSAIAGPDFYVIEKGREAKRAEQRAAVMQPKATQPVVLSVTPRGVVYKRAG